jgi:hypothetical protein
MFVLISEFIIFGPQIRAVSCLEVLPRNLQKADFERNQGIVVNEVGTKVRFAILLASNPSDIRLSGLISRAFLQMTTSVDMVNLRSQSDQEAATATISGQLRTVDPPKKARMAQDHRCRQAKEETSRATAARRRGNRAEKAEQSLTRR